MGSKWLRYHKRTEHEDGSITEMSGNTILGDTVEWLGLGFWVVVSLLFWMAMPFLYVFGAIRDPNFRHGDRNEDPPFPPIEDAPWNQPTDGEPATGAVISLTQRGSGLHPDADSVCKRCKGSGKWCSAYCGCGSLHPCPCLQKSESDGDDSSYGVVN